MSSDRRLWAVLLAAALAVAVGGCGSAATASSSRPSTLATYTDKPFGYTITYDKSRLDSAGSATTSGRVQWAILPGGSRYVGEASIANFVDQDSADRGGGIWINTYQAARTVRPPTLASLQRARSLFIVYLPSRGPTDLVGNHAQHAVEPITINGLTGFQFNGGGNGGQWVDYALFDGRRLYVLVYRASLAAWPGIAPTLEAAVRSFRVTN